MASMLLTTFAVGLGPTTLVEVCHVVIYQCLCYEAEGAGPYRCDQVTAPDITSNYVKVIDVVYLVFNHPRVVSTSFCCCLVHWASTTPLLPDCLLLCHHCHPNMVFRTAFVCCCLEVHSCDVLRKSIRP